MLRVEQTLGLEDRPQANNVSVLAFKSQGSGMPATNKVVQYNRYHSLASPAARGAITRFIARKTVRAWHG